MVTMAVRYGPSVKIQMKRSRQEKQITQLANILVLLKAAMLVLNMTLWNYSATLWAPAKRRTCRVLCG